WFAKMEQAVDAVINGIMSCRKASIQFQLPQTTLERYVKKRKDGPNFVVDKTTGKYHCVFTKDQELELATYLKDMQKRLFGFTMKELRWLAYKLAVRNGCEHPFNEQTEMAGEDLAQSFMKRHPELSLRKPEATSGVRAMGFNGVAVAQFFTLLNKVIIENKITGERIRVQPLDVAFMRPLSLYYEDEVRKWLRMNPGKVVTLFQISTLFGQAFVNAANMKTALKCFEKTGIWPTNEGIFSDSDLLPAETTNIPTAEAQAEPDCASAIVEPAPVDDPIENNDSLNNPSTPPPKVTMENSNKTQNDPLPQCSWMLDNPNAPIKKPNISSFPALPPEIIMPIPKLKTDVKRVQRKRGKTAILTESPYKTELTEAIGQSYGGTKK
ncbi:hypothetical protein NQ318_010753, partial [Aromia moschata]